MPYEIIFSRQAEKFINHLGDKEKERFREVFEKLSENPYSYPYKKIRGKVRMYRIRIGMYRVLYHIEAHTIIVIKIDTREKSYKNL